MRDLIRYSIIRKVKNFNILFWPCLFPLILGTLFYFAFGNMSEADFETIQAAYVEEKGDPVFSMFLEELNQDGSVIQIEKMTKAEASEKLTAREIQGIFVGEKPLIYRWQEAEWLKVSCRVCWKAILTENTLWKLWQGHIRRICSRRQKLFQIIRNWYKMFLLEEEQPTAMRAFSML